jgi:hypothetical protein
MLIRYDLKFAELPQGGSFYQMNLEFVQHISEQDNVLYDTLKAAQSIDCPTDFSHGKNIHSNKPRVAYRAYCSVHTFAIMQIFNAEGTVRNFFSLHILRLSPLTLLPFYNCFIFIIFSSFPHKHPFFSSPLILFFCPLPDHSFVIQKSS